MNREGLNISLPTINSWLEERGHDAVRKLRDMSHGSVNLVYLLGDRYILKANVHDPDDPRFRDEAAAYRLLAENQPELPVPRLIDVDLTRELLPYDVLLLTLLPGEDADRVWDEVAAPNRALLSRELALFLVSQHEVKLDEYGSVAQDPMRTYDSWKDYLRHEVEELVDLHLELGKIDVDLLIRLESTLPELISTLPRPSKPTLVHTDASRWNMKLVRAGETWHLGGLLDYEWCVAGDAHYEFTNMFAHRDHGLDEESFWATYWGVQGREEPPGEFLAKQDCYQMLYHFQLLLVAGRHWGTGGDRWRFHEKALRELLGP